MSAIPGRSPTQDARGSRLWLYPREFAGRYQQIHRGTSLFLHAFLFVVPWLTIGGHRVLGIDVPARQVYVLGTLFTASDGVMLMLVGLFAAFSLFFFTSVMGRLWCGYMCPHSVFLLNWVLPIERAIEGEYNVRKRRDKKGFSFDLAWRKAAKWALFAVVSTVLSMSFMGFFSDPYALWTLQGTGIEYGVTLFFAGLWFFDFTFFREQLCNYLCPYARFQGALMDDHSLVITYDAFKGEPRGGGKKAIAKNACIDCQWCVQACPQGIDIRDGFQLECIACGRCADACSAVHDKVGGEPLISYSTLAADRGDKPTLVRPRTVLYAGLLTAIAAAVLGVLVFRAPFQATVNRAPGSLFQVDDDGYVRNTFVLRITNTDEEPATYTVAIDGLDGVEVTAPPVQLASTESRTVPLVLRVPSDQIASRTVPIEVSIVDADGGRVVRPATFKTPGATN